MTDELEERLSAIFKATDISERALFEEAGAAIRRGELVAFPTETVYGLGADALNADAVKKIYEAKGRPSDNPLILHVCDIKMAESVVEINWRARFLMEKFWPGPLSIVLDAKPAVPERTRGGLSTAAVRMPDNRIALELIKASGCPIAAPSANKSGRPSPTDAETVREDLGDAVKIILDGGNTRVGVESTVLDLTGDHVVLLRPGGVTKEQLEYVLKEEVLLPRDSLMIKRSPGTRYRHYAPSIPLKLCASSQISVKEGTKWAWIGTREPELKPYTKILFSNIEEYTKELFRALRTIEKSGAEIIIAEDPGSTGIALALRDRLERAAGK